LHPQEQEDITKDEGEQKLIPEKLPEMGNLEKVTNHQLWRRQRESSPKVPPPPPHIGESTW
jgi:hypothetical protein